MKKTLAAVAVLGAFAGSAIAADVTLYGIVDAGLHYNHIDMDGQGDDIDTFSMESGQQSGSRWGLKGTEDLGNGLTVGFVLENGFTFDDGQDGGDAMFDRESMLFVEGGFGKLAFGRIGSFNQGQGSFSLIGGLTPFGTSWGYAAQAGTVFATSTRYNNSIVYRTPSFAGFQVTAMYSMGGNDDENESSTDRYYGIAASYNNGPLFGYLAVDSINYKTWYSAHPEAYYDEDAGEMMPAVDPSAHDLDDSLTVTLGGSYDFDVAKVYFGAQYFDNIKTSSIGAITKDFGEDFSFTDAAGESLAKGNALFIEGYAVTLGVDAPVAGGKVMGAVGYMDAENASNSDAVGDFDFTRWSVSVGYDYPLSKRTNVYAVGAYVNDELEGKGALSGQEWNPQSYTLMVGMRHKF